MSLKYRDKNGALTVISGLTPGGNLEAGAVATRKGTTSVPSTSADSDVTVSVAFTDAMPDEDYEVNLHATAYFVIGRISNQTANGFTVTLRNTNSSSSSGNLDWYAFKTYSVAHAEQNASDIADIKGKIPSTASSSNKLATAKDVSDLSSAVDERLDDLEDAVPVDASITNQLVSTSTMNTALGGKQNTLEFDDTPTAGSDNPVTSDGIKDAIDAVEGYVDDTATDIYEVMGKNGAKNLFKNEAVSTSQHNITFTVNTDGSVRANTSSETTTVQWSFRLSKFAMKAGTYILSDSNTGDFSNTCFLQLVNEAETTAIAQCTTSHEVEFTLASDQTVILRLFYKKAVTFDYTYKPMIRYATDTDSTWAPYAMTNQQMTPYIQAISNPNLLDNPWFTINQRGRTTYPNSMNGFSVDRWYKNLNINLDVINNGVRLTKKATSNPTLYQKIEASPYLLGKTVTLSVMTTDGKIRSCTGTFPSTFPSSGNVIVVNFDDDIISFRLQAVSTFNPYFIATLDTENCAIDEYLDIRAVKLELGTVSTLAMDTAPNYPQELAKCQRYFQRIGQAGSLDTLCMATYRNDYTLRTVLPLTVPMRVAPSVTVNGTVSDYTNSGLTMAKISQPVTNGGAAGISFNISKSGVTWNNGVSKCITPDSTDFYIDFSADL